MENRDIVKKYSLAEVVLFLIFAAGVVISMLLVAARGRIDLSKPIPLGRSGIAAPVPVGPGWESGDRWSYEQPNRFELSAVLRTGSRLLATVQYQYLLAAEGIDGQEFLKRTADALRVRIVRTGTIRDGLEVEWVQLQARRTPPDTVVGVAKLPHGRAITIHVRTPGDQLLAMKLFKTLVDGVVYAPQEQLARGAELVGRMQAAGLTQLVQDMGGFEGEQTYYVRDSFDQPRGFVIMQFGRNDTAGEWWKLKGDRVHYLAETRGGLSRSHIESGNALERYIWFTQRTRGRRSAGGESDIRLDADGNLLISGSVQMGDIRCRPALTVPEMLIAQAARVFLDGPTEETVINVLFDRGSIVPAAVTAPDATRDEENYWRAPHCVRFEYLHAADNETRLYFDARKRLVGRIDGAGRTLIWEPADRRRLTEAFGDIDRLLGVDGRTR